MREWLDFSSRKLICAPIWVVPKPKELPREIMASGMAILRKQSNPARSKSQKVVVEALDSIEIRKRNYLM